MRFRSWFQCAAAVAILASLSQQALAQSDIIVRWTFEDSLPFASDQATYGPVTPELQRNNNWFGAASGVHASALTDWSNPVGNGSAESFSSNNWAIGDYWQFHTTTQGLSNIGLGFDATRSSTGPAEFKVAYSLDGTNFTDSFNYTLDPISWSSQSRSDASLFTFDFRNVTALNNAADIYFRLISTSAPSSANGTQRIDNVTIMHNFDPSDPFPPPPPPTPPPPPDPGVLPQPGDVVLGHSTSNGLFTLEIARGPATAGGGVHHDDPWYLNPFIQSVEFDNYGGQSHNARGNLLGVNFNQDAAGYGTIYNFSTQHTLAPAGELIGSTAAGHASHGGAVSPTRLGGLSVSPDNTKVAVTGFDTGAVIVFDYVAGNTEGSGASLSGGRQTSQILATGRTQGSAWLSNTHVLSFTLEGDLLSVNATDSSTMSATPSYLNFVTLPDMASEFTDIEYNPTVSPYVYATYGGFTSAQDPTPAASQSTLFIFNPATSFSLVNEVDLTGNMALDSVREIALDQNGNLFMSAVGGRVWLLSDVVTAPGSIADNSAVLWFDSGTNSTFNGIDVGMGEVAGLAGDYNGDNVVDARDYVLWRKNPDAHGGNPDGYTAWKANFGATASGSGSALGAAAAVPEPASIALVALALAAAFCGRRRGA